MQSVFFSKIGDLFHEIKGVDAGCVCQVRSSCAEHQMLLLKYGVL